jgi:hypothetical protein
MKSRLPWLCSLVLLISVGALFWVNRKQAAELASLQQATQENQAARATADENAKTQDQAKDAELASLRADKEDLLRLRNEVRQLKGQNQDLNKQVQTAQSQAQSAQAQAEGAQAQMQALRQTAAQAQAQQAVNDAAFRARYGIAPNASDQEKANVCMNNLRQIDGAKQRWALEHVKTVGAVPTEADLRPYFNNNPLPTCPSGGSYNFNPVQLPPTCTIPGHVLPR